MKQTLQDEICIEPMENNKQNKNHDQNPSPQITVQNSNHLPQSGLTLSSHIFYHTFASLLQPLDLAKEG